MKWEWVPVVGIIVLEVRHTRLLHAVLRGDADAMEADIEVMKSIVRAYSITAVYTVSIVIALVLGVT